MKTKTLVLILLTLPAIVACGEKKSAQPPPPPEISVVEVRAQEIPLFVDFVGQTSGLKDIAIRARVEGFLEGIHFQEGSEVKTGDLLYTLESQPFREKVATQMSAVAEAKTMLAKAKGDLDRIEPLAASRAVSQSDLDEAVAMHEAAIASVDAAEATLKRIHANLKRYRASVLKAAVEGKLVPTEAELARRESRDYEPGSVLLDRILKERRRRWEEAELAKLRAKGKKF